MNQIERIFKKIIRAKIYQVAKRTPLDEAVQTSSETGNRIFMKREDHQNIFSFKIRGAYHAISQLPADIREKGVICSSAGNHAQGVAKSALHLGIPAHIVMPMFTPQIKIDAVKRLKGKIHRAGDTLYDAGQVALKMAEEKNLTFIHPFDNEDVIAGQGTIGMEMYQDCEKIDYVFVPIGGGGLIAGILIYLKTLQPDIKIIGVEPENSDSMSQALAHGKPVRLKHVETFADGVAVPLVGAIPFSICRKLLDGIILTNSDKICSAIKRIYYETRVLMEPSGALSMAGALQYIKDHRLKNKNIITINCGANMNFDILRYVSQNSKVGEGKEILMAVDIPEQPGALKRVCNEVIKDRQITEFNYRYFDNRDAKIFLGIETKEEAEHDKIKDILQKLNYKAIDLTDDKLSKNHIRYMVGGRPQTLKNERVFSVVFPEKLNALYHFLNAMEISWNISLFHYVSNGSSYSHVFVGIQVPPSDNAKLLKFLEKVNYKFEEQTNNESYISFLR